MTVELEQLVGERTVPQLWHENYWFRRHEIAYLALADRIAGADVVLEAGCGEGYGIPLLRTALGSATLGSATPGSARAPRIVGLDYDPAAARHVADAYGAPVARSNLAALPLADDGVDAIVCFQVIEHLWTPWEFVGECARVLRPGGVLLITTPNRPTFSPGLGRGEKPLNPFHIKEFDQQELLDTIDPQLPVTEVLGIDHGPRLRAWEAEHGDLMAAQLASAPAGWSPELAGVVRSVRADDFELAGASPGVHDLVVVARKASS